MTLIRVLLALVIALPLSARPYHLELEATPKAAFPWLGRFGDVTLHVYEGGVRGEALWLNGFSRNGAKAVTIVNPLGRMYVDVAVREIAPTLRKLAGTETAEISGASPKPGPTLKGKVRGIDATRHRLMYGKAAWVDVWTTTVIPPNAQLRTIVAEVVRGISPRTATAVEKLPGTPVYVELNFRRFKKVPLVRLKKLTFAADDQADALTLGKLYVRATLLEKILGVK
jgi:hypothetical protein